MIVERNRVHIERTDSAVWALLAGARIDAAHIERSGYRAAMRVLGFGVFVILCALVGACPASPEAQKPSPPPSGTASQTPDIHGDVQPPFPCRSDSDCSPP